MADIIDTAAEAGSFTTLIAAVRAAGLVETLKGAGPFTVLAPTDEAFAALPAGAVEDLLKPENLESLKAVLLYHVLPGRFLADDVVEMTKATTVQGQEIEIEATDVVKFNGNTVLKPDVLADNGVIHVINGVLTPISE
ncbi:MAG: fasciclin domain-containing protein [Cytophagales bacterium]|nr:fasciclin domain-containing protein [Armatimonadota bacterium]